MATVVFQYTSIAALITEQIRFCPTFRKLFVTMGCPLEQELIAALKTLGLRNSC